MQVDFIECGALARNQDKSW